MQIPIYAKEENVSTEEASAHMLAGAKRSPAVPRRFTIEGGYAEGVYFQ
jgi:hypothetical protein